MPRSYVRTVPQPGGHADRGPGTGPALSGPAAHSGALVSGAAGQPAVRRRASGAVVGSLKGGDVQLAHAEHCLHGALGAVGIGATDQLSQHGRHHLPREPVPVFEPTALAFLAPVGQGRPVPVHFFLRRAVDDKGHRLIERESRPPVQCSEGAPVKLEADSDRLAGRPGTTLAIPRDVEDFAAVEDGDLVPGGFLGLAVEPPAGGDCHESHCRESPGPQHLHGVMLYRSIPEIRRSGF